MRGESASPDNGEICLSEYQPDWLSSWEVAEVLHVGDGLLTVEIPAVTSSPLSVDRLLACSTDHGALELLTLELILSNRVLYIDDSTVTRREK